MVLMMKTTTDNFNELREKIGECIDNGIDDTLSVQEINLSDVFAENSPLSFDQLKKYQEYCATFATMTGLELARVRIDNPLTPTFNIVAANPVTTIRTVAYDLPSQCKLESVIKVTAEHAPITHTLDPELNEILNEYVKSVLVELSGDERKITASTLYDNGGYIP